MAKKESASVLGVSISTISNRQDSQRIFLAVLIGRKDARNCQSGPVAIVSFLLKAYSACKFSHLVELCTSSYGVLRTRVDR